MTVAGLLAGYGGLSPSIVYDSAVSFAVATATPLGPTIPNTVDTNYIGILMEYTSATSTNSVPSGWTQALASVTSGGAGLRICYKQMAVSDRGGTPGSLAGGNQRDMLFLFRDINSSIFNLAAINPVTSAATGNMTSTAPTVSSSQAAISIHYFYNSTTATPTVASNPAMTLVRSTANSYHGGQYRIYNPGSAPANQVAGGTFAGTIQQGLFWLVVN